MDEERDQRSLETGCESRAGLSRQLADPSDNTRHDSEAPAARQAARCSLHIPAWATARRARSLSHPPPLDEVPGPADPARVATGPATGSPAPESTPTDEPPWPGRGQGSGRWPPEGGAPGRASAPRTQADARGRLRWRRSLLEGHALLPLLGEQRPTSIRRSAGCDFSSEEVALLMPQPPAPQPPGRKLPPRSPRRS